jgi:lipopolysaccharide export system protein LptA
VVLAFALVPIRLESAEQKEFSVPVEIRGKKVEYRSREGRAFFSGGVRVKRGTAFLVSDELETLQGASEAIARGHVVFSDEERRMDLTCAELHYVHGLKQVHARTDCRLISGEGVALTVVLADEMDLLVDEREAVARGRVKITQGPNEARCRMAHLYGAEDRLVLSGRPLLLRPPHEFECDEAVTFVKESRTILTGSVRGKLHTERLDELKQGSP